MYETMRWEGNALILLDQTKLPLEVDYVTCFDYRKVAECISSMVVRGAPAIGAAAAFGMALGFKELLMYNLAGTNLVRKFEQIKRELIATRPTAVNLAWAVNTVWEAAIRAITTMDEADAVDVIDNTALKIFQDDINNNKLIGKFGAELLPNNAKVLTHCNAGALATCGWGTALGVIRQAHADGKIRMVFSDETRPLLQGARLTAWELQQDNIPVTLITDGMAAWTMKNKHVDAVIVGADRIALNGDTANKIGTFGVALAAKALKIPFYVAAPSSSFDFKMATGSSIPIEERGGEEIRIIGSQRLTLDEIKVYNPGFDVTPNELISGIITEFGVLKAPYQEKILQLGAKRGRR